MHLNIHHYCVLNCVQKNWGSEGTTLGIKRKSFSLQEFCFDVHTLWHEPSARKSECRELFSFANTASVGNNNFLVCIKVLFLETQQHGFIEKPLAQQEMLLKKLKYNKGNQLSGRCPWQTSLTVAHSSLYDLIEEMTSLSSESSHF